MKEGVQLNVNLVNPREKLIPNKIKFLSRCFLLTIIELLFFILFSFLGWIDSFLSVIGVKSTITSILPLALYFILFSTFFLFIYLVMYNINREKLSLKEFLPKTRMTIVYFFYMYLSIVLRLFILLVLLFMFRGFHSILQLFILLPIYLLIFTSLEILLSNTKNFLLFEDSKLYHEWQFDKKSFLFEFLKFIGIIGLILAMSCFIIISNNSGNSITVSSILGFVLIWLTNTFFAIIVLLKKRHYHKTTTCALEENFSNDTKDINKKPLSKKMVYLKQRGLVLGVLAVVGIYSVCLVIPYIINYDSKINKPKMESFKSQNDVVTFFSNVMSSFKINSRNSNNNYLGEFLYTFNKMFISIAKLEPDFLFTGVVANSKKTAYSSQSAAHSDTNNQVDNVDEADVVKTDGKHIYYLNETNLFIVDSYPPDQMKVIHQYDFSSEGLYPLEMFLYEDYLAVILISSEEQPDKKYSSKTIVKTYNIKDPSNPRIQRNFQLDYRYLSSRMIENNLYLITSSYISDTLGNPGYMDSSLSNSMVEIDYKDLLVMSNSNKQYSRMNVVATFPIDEPDQRAQVKAYIGGNGENVYVSTHHIFIADTTISPVTEAPVEDFLRSLVNYDYDLNFQKRGTCIYRIKINNGVIGEYDSDFVPGTVHNQFAMDEHKGYFRLTTQTGTFRYASSNVYVLDENMNLCGSLEGLAPEEQIYAS